MRDSGKMRVNSKNNIIAKLGDLGPDTVITERSLADLFQRHPSSVKRAVSRGESRLFGKSIWALGAIVHRTYEADTPK